MLIVFELDKEFFTSLPRKVVKDVITPLIELLSGSNNIVITNEFGGTIFKDDLITRHEIFRKVFKIDEYLLNILLDKGDAFSLRKLFYDVTRLHILEPLTHDVVCLEKLYLFLINRRYNIDEVIKPNLEKGKAVICIRCDLSHDTEESDSIYQFTNDTLTPNMIINISGVGVPSDSNVFKFEIYYENTNLDPIKRIFSAKSYFILTCEGCFNTIYNNYLNNFYTIFPKDIMRFHFPHRDYDTQNF